MLRPGRIVLLSVVHLGGRGEMAERKEVIHGIADIGASGAHPGGRRIVTGQHCYGCTADCGSECQGAVLD